MRTALSAARLLAACCSSPATARTRPAAFLLSRFYSAQPLPETDPLRATVSSDDRTEGDAAASTPDFEGISIGQAPARATWDKAYREKADRLLFGGKKIKRIGDDEEEGDESKSRKLARALLETALMERDDMEEINTGMDAPVKEEDQKSLNVGIVGAPNAGKSSLTNLMTGKKVAAVSRKTNTTTHEMLGTLTEQNTQICFFDTPGITLGLTGYPQKTDVRSRVQSAWKAIDHYDLLVVMFDAHRHITVRRDPRVIKLINYFGEEAQKEQKRVLCMNKVDLVEDKKQLLKVAEEFKDLPGYDRYFMISALKGSGVKDLAKYLKDQAIQRPWEEEVAGMSEETMKMISLEVVREKMLNYIHQELPYVIEHRLMDWQELGDGSLRIEQHFIAEKQSQRQILVGKRGAMIGKIGMEANEELRSIFGKDVHLILQVRVVRRRGA